MYNQRDGDMLSKRQKRLIKSILKSKSITEACQKTKTPRITYYSWLKNPEFVAEIDNAKQKICEENEKKLQNLQKNTLYMLEMPMNVDDPVMQLKFSSLFLKKIGKIMTINRKT